MSRLQRGRMRPDPDAARDGVRSAQAATIERTFEAYRSEAVIHAAAVVGGIGANRMHPGRFFYENAIMGIQIIEEARRRASRSS